MARNQRDEPREMLEVFPNDTSANGTAVATMNTANAGTALAPAGVTTSTIAKWLKVEQDGVTYFVPMWT